MNRIQVLRESKFNKMTEVEMTHVKGGWFCLLCKKQARKIPVVGRIEESSWTISASSYTPLAPVEKNKVSVFRRIN